MNLPKNGRIVIVDDKIQEAQPLISILSKKRIPFNYYLGTNSEDFPNDPNENKLRVLFLDLNIFELNKDPKSVISSIHGILDSLIPNQPNPYLLIIWSKQANNYLAALEDHFLSALPHKSPAKIIFLQKSKYFDYDVELGWNPQAGALDRIEEDLNAELENISLLRNLINWENIIHSNASETVNEFFSFFPNNNHWDKNSKAVLYRLAKAVVGENDISQLNDQQKLAKAFININSFLLDKVEAQVEQLSLGDVTNIIDNGTTIDADILTSINTKLHTSLRPFAINNFEQGHLYEIPNEENMIERIIWDGKFKDAKRKEILSSNPRLFHLDITPVCDYSNDKRYVRVIYGLMLDPKFSEDCKSHYYYTSPPIKIAKESKFLLFDFRHLVTLTKDVVIAKGIIPLLKLRRELCTDIQSQLANQVNRPGISKV